MLSGMIASRAQETTFGGSLAGGIVMLPGFVGGVVVPPGMTGVGFRPPGTVGFVVEPVGLVGVVVEPLLVVEFWQAGSLVGVLLLQTFVVVVILVNEKHKHWSSLVFSSKSSSLRVYPIACVSGASFR